MADLLDAQLTSCQEQALAELEGLQNVFLTGGAGSGKSFLVRRYLSDKDPRTFPVLASTGAASVLVGGRTFHSFFGLGIMEGGPEATIEKACLNRQVQRRLRKINGFVVDEVSMLSGPTLRVAEVVCRRVRGSDLPWGGLKVVAVGDFAQLPPVERAPQIQRSWAFLDSVWTWSNFRMAYLRTQTRCRDEEYMRILNQIREGDVTAEVREYLDSKTHPLRPDHAGTRLFPRRQQTDAYNMQKLEELSAELHSFETVWSGADRQKEQLRKYAPIPDVLHLKEGCLVMLRQNDPQGRWVNGSTGWLNRITSNRLTIELMNGRDIEIEKSTFSLLDAEGEIVAAGVNFPVSLAYATTIHKSQGSTLDRLVVNLRNLWEPGQAYVALSRVTTGKDLAIEAWNPSSIRVDDDVVQFYRGMI